MCLKALLCFCLFPRSSEGQTITTTTLAGDKDVRVPIATASEGNTETPNEERAVSGETGAVMETISEGGDKKGSPMATRSNRAHLLGETVIARANDVKYVEMPSRQK